MTPAVKSTRLPRLPRRAVAGATLLLAAGLGVAVQAQTLPAPPAIPARPAMPPVVAVEAVGAWPHDPGAFTQGLVFHEGRLLESTGLYGQSSVREVELETGQVLRSAPVAAEYFAEGLTLFEGQLVQLTWKEQQGFVYGLEDFARQGGFAYPGEGWGLTHDGARLIMSDGSSRLRFLDPATYEEVAALEVRDPSGPVRNLNELEWVRGEIWANIWITDRIARIDPTSGEVLAYLDLSGLLPADVRRTRQVDVLNGIAYDPAGDRVFVTGKWWPLLFEIRPQA
jgi:glutamine cyclotransferase